jgi:histidine triad (HIT) family protein
MASIFSMIVAGDIPAYKVAETDQFLAFLDIRPVAKGHTLVIPKQEIDYFFNIEDDQLGAMMVFAKKVAKAVEAVVPCIRIGVTVIGLEVPHAHVHLIPLNSLGDMLRFGQTPVAIPAEEMASLADEIHTAYLASLA